MKKRITMTIYDDKAFEFLQSRTLNEMISSTQETGLCLMVYQNGIQVYVEKTKAGYKISACDTNSKDVNNEV